jgi:hypothetical protein
MGKPAPAKLVLTTKPKDIADLVYKEIRYRDKVEVERNSKANIDKLKKNAHNYNP